MQVLLDEFSLKLGAVGAIQPPSRRIPALTRFEETDTMNRIQAAFLLVFAALSCANPARAALPAAVDGEPPFGVLRQE